MTKETRFNNVFLGLGTNQGNLIENLDKAIDSLSQNFGQLIIRSKTYVCPAWGKTDQADFYNEAAILKTSKSAEEALISILGIEKEMGRVRKERWGPRLIDIDILFFNNEIIDLPKLKIPHSLLHKRNFVLVPLYEIAKNHIHPKLNMTIEEIYNECSDISAIKPLENR